MSLRPKTYETAKKAYKPLSRKTGLKRSGLRKHTADTSEAKIASSGLRTRKRSIFKPSRPSPEDAAWRKAVLERDGYQCRWVDETGQRCEVAGEEYLDAHHILTRGQRPDKRLDVSNGAALCGGPGRHHDRLHHTVGGRKRGRELGLLGTETYEKAMKGY